MAIHRKEITKLLRVELTAEEVYEAAARMASAVLSLRETERSKKESLAGYKERIDSARADMAINAELIDKGTREEEIACEQVFDYKLSKMAIFRLDTGDQVEERELTEEERQMEFPDEPNDDQGEIDAETGNLVETVDA